MGILKYDWEFEIAPAPIVLNMQRGSRSGKNKYKLFWGRYLKEKTFSGLNYPKVGEVVEVPDFGKCKIERLIPFHGNKISRNFHIRVVISWKALGNKAWWDSNINCPDKFGWELRKLTKEDLKIFGDLEIPDPKEIKLKQEIADKLRLWRWQDEKSKIFDPTSW